MGSHAGLKGGASFVWMLGHGIPTRDISVVFGKGTESRIHGVDL
jgi:hypothetical protein